jgi:hypothetical protein
VAGAAGAGLELVAALSIAGLMLAGPAHAQDVGMVVALAQSVEEVLNNVRNWVVGILASLATVFLTIGVAVLAGPQPSRAGLRRWCPR